MLFPFPLVAQNYSHSHGNPMGMGIPIPMHTSSTYSQSINQSINQYAFNAIMSIARQVKFKKQ